MILVPTSIISYQHYIVTNITVTKTVNRLTVLFIICSRLWFMIILVSSNDLSDLYGVLRNDIFEHRYNLCRINIKNSMRQIFNISIKHTICIHVDKKAQERFFEALESISKCFDNILLSVKREDVIYSHFTRLQVRFLC